MICPCARRPRCADEEGEMLNLNIVCMLATALSVALFVIGALGFLAPGIQITENWQLPSILRDSGGPMAVIGFLGMVIIPIICKRFF